MKNNNEFLRTKPRDAKGEQLLSFMVKMVTMLAIFLGIWASTQTFCAIVNYDSAWVGDPFHVLRIGEFAFPLYNPFLIFYWTLAYFRRTQIHPYLYESFKIAGYVSAGAMAFYFLAEFIIIRAAAQNIFGTARWGNDKDLKKAGLLGFEGGMILGQTASAKVTAEYDMTKKSVILHLKKASRKIIQAGIYNTLLSAPTRSGKGVSCVVPTLQSYPGSVIVLDFKGENFDFTSGFRSRFGKVYRWEPTGDKGHHFNPMMEIRPGEDAFSDANLIADILTTPAEGGGNANSEHFRTGAKDFLTAVILHCLCSDWKNKSLPGLNLSLSSRQRQKPQR